MIQIGFSTGKSSPISAAIRFFTKSKTSHAFLIYDDETLGDQYILEADIGGFQPMRYSLFKKKNNVVAEVDPIVPMGAALKAADKWVGEAYDYEGLLGNILPMVGRWFKQKWKTPFHNPKAMFCSEAVVKVLQLA